MRVDTEGNVWTSAGHGVDVFEPGGSVLGRINFPQDVSNLVFGGPKLNRLFITCTHELYSVFVMANGAQRP
jgi:gluconolactonase